MTAMGKGNAVPRLLVVRMDNIGDMVMMTPALRALRAALPQAHVCLMTSPAGSRVVPLLSGVDEVLFHRALWQELGAAPRPLLEALPGSGSGQGRRDGWEPAAELALVERVRELRCEAALVFTSFRQSPHVPAYVCHLAGIPVRAGISKEFGGLVLTHAVSPPPDSMHQVDRNLILLEGLGIPSAGRHLELRIPPEADREAASLLADAGVPPGSPFVVLAPTASCPARTYPMERFARLAELLVGEARLPLVLVGRAEERPVLAGLGPVLGRVHRLDGRTSVPVLAAVIRRAALLVASHSGPMHIADAVGCPMVVLFSGTDLESQWRPRSAPARLLGRPVACSPCYGLRCPFGMGCLDVDPADAAAACIELLHTSSLGRRPCALSAS